MELILGDLQFGQVECGPFCGIEAEDEHPNAVPFKGILLVVDEASNRPPNGAEGHRILVPKKVAKNRLSTLIGMGLNYFNQLDRHNPTKKIGVIEKAWIKGKNVWCSGIIWAKDFPDAQRSLRTKGMGMSMELADVLVEDKQSAVWKLIDFDFTGATALLKRAAAYESTTLAASACEISDEGKEAAMPKTASSKTGGNSDLAKLIAAAVGVEVRKGLAVVMKPVTEALQEVHASLDTQNETLGALAAASMKDDDDAAAHAMHSDDDDAAAAKDSDDDDAAAAKDSDDDDAAAAADKDAASSSSTSSEEHDEDELSAELADLEKSMSNGLATTESGDSDPNPGHLNKNAKNKGSKKVVSAAAERHNSRLFDIAASAVKKVHRVEKQHGKMVKELKAQRKKTREVEEQLDELQAQSDQFSTAIHRRTLPANYHMLLEKSGHSVGDIMASGNKLTIEQQDAIVRAARESGINMSILDAVTFKTKLVEADLAE